MMRLRPASRGFTIIELMIATLVFSTVLLLCATGLISIGRMYQKGSISRVTQEAARSTIDVVKSDFELSGGSYKAFAINSGVGSTNAFCIGQNLYAYQLNHKRNSDSTGNAFVVVSGSSDCAGAGQGAQFSRSLDDVAAGSGARELLGANMRLTILDLRAYPNDTDVQSLSIKLSIAWGDDDLLTSGGSCKGGAGQEWCGSSTLETYATRRIQ